MRWPWSGIREEFRLLRAQHHRHIEEYRRFTTEMVLDMHRHAEARERRVDQELAAMREESRQHRARTQAEHEELLAEQRAGREAFLRVLDRLPPPATGTA